MGDRAAVDRVGLAPLGNLLRKRLAQGSTMSDGEDDAAAAVDHTCSVGQSAEQHPKRKMSIQTADPLDLRDETPVERLQPPVSVLPPYANHPHHAEPPQLPVCLRYSSHTARSTAVSDSLPSSQDLELTVLRSRTGSGICPPWAWWWPCAPIVETGGSTEAEDTQEEVGLFVPDGKK